MIKNYGTKKPSITSLPTVASPSTLSELFEEYKKFSLLKKKDDMSNGVEAGIEAYLVSSLWLKSYVKFILFE